LAWARPMGAFDGIAEGVVSFRDKGRGFSISRAHGRKTERHPHHLSRWSKIRGCTRPTASAKSEKACSHREKRLSEH
jgi:hypothetical protein